MSSSLCIFDGEIAAKGSTKLRNGKIRPSKGLVDALVGMLEGKREFVLIDDQKVVFESALAASEVASQTEKRVIIVKGGPGTGKYVVAVNLLVELTNVGSSAGMCLRMRRRGLSIRAS